MAAQRREIAMRLWPSLLLLCLAASPLPVLAQASSSAPADQASAPALSSAEVLKLIVDACTQVIGGDASGPEKMTDGGWTPNEIEDTGPYNAVYSGFRDVAPYGEIDLWASVQSFPSQHLGYCRVDFGDTDNALDFAAMTGIAGLTGSIEPRAEGNVYGAWESADKKLLVIGDRTAGAVELEFNLLPGSTPAQ
jgi:hypothetical protein